MVRSGAGPVGSRYVFPLCLLALYLEWRVLVRGDAKAAAMLCGLALLVGGPMLVSLGLGMLGLLGVVPLAPGYATWSELAWMAGVAASLALLGGGHWLWASRVTTASAEVH